MMDYVILSEVTPTTCSDIVDEVMDGYKATALIQSTYMQMNGFGLPLMASAETMVKCGLLSLISDTLSVCNDGQIKCLSIYVNSGGD